jgi:hypothetical protein
MYKKIAAFCIIFISISVFGSPVPTEKLDSYKEAVSIALDKVPLTCKLSPEGATWSRDGFSDQAFVKELVLQATSADLDTTGMQPILTFSYNTLVEVQTIAITTSEDYQSIVKIDFSQYTVSNKQVNLGTLIDPNIVTQEVKSDPVSASCKSL